MTASWVDGYLRTPYVLGGDGIEGCDCWGLFRLIQSNQFGREIPALPDIDGFDISIDPTLKGSLTNMKVVGQERRTHWAEVLEPMEGDAVMMSHSRYPSHVGVWVELRGGAVLHCTQGAGVTLQRPLDLAANYFSIKRYYRYVG
jgi:cell wall-associated NlpC family hydrolase